MPSKNSSARSNGRRAAGGKTKSTKGSGTTKSPRSRASTPNSSSPPATSRKPGKPRQPTSKKRPAKSKKRAAKPSEQVPPEPTVTPPKGKKWFVLAVDTGADGPVLKAINKRKKIESMERLIGKCYSPIKLREAILPKAGKELARGKEATPDEAKLAARVKAWELAGAGWWDSKSDPEGMKTSIFPAKAKEKGKQGNGWEWVVRSLKSEGERRALIRERKFPGYLIVHLKYTPRTHHLIEGTRGVIGFLPARPALGRHPTKAEVEAREAWKPVPLESEEAAELLCQQMAENKAHKEATEKIVLTFKVGDEVTIKEGAFKGMSGKVLAITGNERAPAVQVEVNILGRAVPATVKFWEVQP